MTFAELNDGDCFVLAPNTTGTAVVWCKQKPSGTYYGRLKPQNAFCACNLGKTSQHHYDHMLDDIEVIKTDKAAFNQCYDKYTKTGSKYFLD